MSCSSTCPAFSFITTSCCEVGIVILILKRDQKYKYPAQEPQVVSGKAGILSPCCLTLKLVIPQLPSPTGQWEVQLKQTVVSLNSGSGTGTLSYIHCLTFKDF